ncbi:MAG: Trk family potassium uptake protein, partial [Oscillospiraceae bacterium]|nr:Trk family potassium uptake protein [Oscillospiraceae bacterium]
VWKDLGEKRFAFKRYNLHTKIVLATSAILTFGGAVIFFTLEKSYSGADMSLGDRIITAFFTSVTARTAGFCTVDPVNMGGGSKLFMCFLMLIGGSSGSTAGGIKTTTIAVIAIYAAASIRNKQYVSVFRRSLDDESFKKAVSIICLSFALGFCGAIVISALQQDAAIIDVVYETFSAIGTVGITAGLTGKLCMASRYIIIFLMYCGRVGSTSFAGALLEKKAMPAITYPGEQITIG